MLVAQHCETWTFKTTIRDDLLGFAARAINSMHMKFNRTEQNDKWLQTVWHGSLSSFVHGNSSSPKLGFDVVCASIAYTLLCMLTIAVRCRVQITDQAPDFSDAIWSTHSRRCHLEALKLLRTAVWPVSGALTD